MQSVSSIEEVNAKIPLISGIFERITSLNERSASISKDIQSLFEIWGESLRSEKNPDHEFYLEKMEKKKGLNREIQREIKRINELGGIVKDIQKGLVDFYFERGGEGVYLCWKMGETEIKHWHPVRRGFAARRPIEELFQASCV
jgi:hypothetical protein